MGNLHLDNQTIIDDCDIDQDIPAFDDTDDDDELTDNDRHDIATVDIQRHKTQWVLCLWMSLKMFSK